jgi:hypothetical protein
MVVESAQMLSNPFPQEMTFYKRTHWNHPCSRWVRETTANYSWLLKHALSLLREYKIRFERTHLCVDVVMWCAVAKWYLLKTDLIVSADRTPFAQAMPEQYRGGDAIEAYRRYYRAEKARFARWERGRSAPSWWTGS